MSTRTPITGEIETNIAARQAHVVGSGPRIVALANEEVDQESRDLINAVRAGAGAGPAVIVPEYMRIVIKHPELFRAQMNMGQMFYNGRLPRRERELAILRVAWLTQSPYEWGEHVDIGQRCGLTAEEVERVIHGSAAPGWSEFDRAVLRSVEELLADYAISDATWEVLAGTWDEAQLLEYPSMIGQYVTIAFLQNSIRVPLAEDNPGMSHR